MAEDMTAMDYEILLRRAYDCGRYGRKGVDADEFRNLSMHEWEAKEQPNNAELQKKYNRKLEEVKGYVSKGLEQGIKTLSKSGSATQGIADIQKHILSAANAKTSADLGKAVRSALDTFIENGIEMS